MTDYTRKFKKECAEKAVKMMAADIQQMEIAAFLNIPKSTLKHWLKDFKEGKFDKPDPVKRVKKSKSTKQDADIMPALIRIARAQEGTNKALENLASGLEQVCIRLDSVYQKMSEFEDISSKLGGEFNQDDS